MTGVHVDLSDEAYRTLLGEARDKVARARRGEASATSQAEACEAEGIAGFAQTKRREADGMRLHAERWQRVVDELQAGRSA